METITTSVEKKFSEMGAKVRLGKPRNVSWAETRPFTVNIVKGEFVINKADDVDVNIIDFDRDDRHLLLMASIPSLNRKGIQTGTEKQRYLCGHDERDWFTCAIPTTVKSIVEAKEALKPTELRSIESTTVKQKDKQKRHRKAKGLGKIHRQGEFMFIPMIDWKPEKHMIVHKKEPMRSNGRPHVAAELIRIGGRTVYTLGNRVLEAEQFKALQKTDPKDASRWRLGTAEPTVYARGTIRHPDHKTLDLGETWHKVLVNTEQKATFVRNVLFID